MSKESNLEKGFIIIPAYIAKEDVLSFKDKYVFGVIFGLSSKTGACWASNEYMEENFGIKERQIQRSINVLIKNNFIGREVNKSEKDGWTSERKLWITTRQNCHPRPVKNDTLDPSKMTVTTRQKCRVDKKLNYNKDYNKYNTHPDEANSVSGQVAEEGDKEIISTTKKPISSEWEELMFTKDEAMKVRKKFLDKDLGQVDIDFAVLQLRIWAENNPNKWKKRKSPYLNLIGWPLERAIENKIKSLRLERESNYLAKSKKEN